MKTHVLYITIVVIGILSTGFISINKIDGNVVSSQISGVELYQVNCASCHGIHLKGHEPQFPSLKAIEQRMNKSQISDLLIAGKNLMPSFSYLSSEERKVIIDFLFGETAVSNIQTTIPTLKLGEQLFIANCNSCHKLSANDQAPKDNDKRRMCSTNLKGINSIYSLSQFVVILNSGPCNMPSFDELDQEKKQAIYSFLSSFKVIEKNKDATCNSKCRCR